jgi:hypothetical protein
MPRKSLFTIGLLLVLLAAPAPAGEIKVYDWPTHFIPQEVAAIPVVLDVGFWMEIVNQYVKIKLHQVSLHTYEGCVDLQVRTNFNLTLSSSITPTGAIGGSYSSSILGPDIDVPGGTATLCAKLTNANLVGKPGGSKNVHVATITVKVVPRL